MGGALQLAIWEVLYEPAATVYNVSSGSGFKVDNAYGNTTVISQANLLLGALASTPDYSRTTTFWKNDGNQDLIGPVSPIPEASTYIVGILLGIPLLVNVARCWRRSRLS